MSIWKWNLHSLCSSATAPAGPSIRGLTSRNIEPSNRWRWSFSHRDWRIRVLPTGPYRLSQVIWVTSKELGINSKTCCVPFFHLVIKALPPEVWQGMGPASFQVSGQWDVSRSHGATFRWWLWKESLVLCFPVTRKRNRGLVLLKPVCLVSFCIAA